MTPPDINEFNPTIDIKYNVGTLLDFTLDCTLNFNGKCKLGNGKIVLRDYVDDSNIAEIPLELEQVEYDSENDITSVFLFCDTLPEGRHMYLSQNSSVFLSEGWEGMQYELPSKEESSFHTPKKIAKDVWGFSNYSSKTNLPIWIAMFGPFQGALLYATNSNNWENDPAGGLCAGMVGTLMTFDLGYISATDFVQKGPPVSKVRDLIKQAYTDTIGMTAEEYIKLAYVLQFYSFFQKQKKDNKGKLADIFDAVSAYQESSKNPVYLSIRSDEGGHALWPYAVDVQDEYCSIFLYDCNTPKLEQEIRLYGKYPDFERWEYLRYSSYKTISSVMGYESCYKTAKAFQSIQQGSIWNLGSIASDNYDLFATNIDSFDMIDSDGNKTTYDPDAYNGDVIVPIETTGGGAEIPNETGLFWIKENVKIDIKNDVDSPQTITLASDTNQIEINMPHLAEAEIGTTNDSQQKSVYLRTENNDHVAVSYSYSMNNEVASISVGGNSESLVMQGSANGLIFNGIDTPLVTVKYDNIVLEKRLDISDEKLVFVELKAMEQNTYVIVQYDTDSDGICDSDLIEAIPLYTAYTVRFDANGGVITTTTMRTGTNGKLSALPIPNRNGYTFEGWYTSPSGGQEITTSTVFVENTTIYAHWDYTDNGNSSGGGGSSSGGNGGGSSGPSSSKENLTSIPSMPGGKVTANPSHAAKGTVVTLTVTPNAGYRLDELVVTDNKGNEPELTDKGNGKYTFVMPTGKVEVTAVFEQIPEISAPVATSLPFTDVGPDDWYADAVRYVYDKGIMTGTSSSTFSPGMTTTRSMVVTILYRLEGEPTVSASAFADITDNQWYSNAVNWAAEHKIVNGYGNGNFGPDDTVTREQIAVILYRYAQYKHYDTSARDDLSEYTDVEQIGSYAAEAMQWANASKLITGTTAVTLAPAGEATRSELVAMLMRFVEHLQCDATISKT